MPPNDIIYGRNPVLEALKAKRSITKIYALESINRTHIDQILSLCRNHNIPVRYVSKSKLSELAGNVNHQGIIAMVSGGDYSTLEAVLSTARERGEEPLIALLDEIQDPHNLGAIVRSAEAFGFHGIIIPKDRSVGLTQTVAKTSAGALEHMHIVRVTNLAKTIDLLKDEGFWIAGTNEGAEKTIEDIDCKTSLVVVIGSEGKGMRRLVREKCDFLVRVPMVGKINSLNASVAAAIIFWEVRKARAK
ncbi:23S rRNA (guanosine(2251)-2'-O)-methyltransferase RlmB [candidate division KSB1 bacterium]|nr:23S rRNA (guanosine(2251)-2'-O)-methyltransferase RlmB [candidate division KSB1 bacterium]